MTRLLGIAFALIFALVPMAAAQSYRPGETPVPQFGERPKGWLISPGFYHDFDDAIGGEVSFIRGIFGLALGVESEGAGYLEAELLIGPVSFGLGPRWQDGGIKPQMTVALPLFFIFPYWRWQNEPVEDGGDRVREFGIMIKVPFTSGGKVMRVERPEDEVI